MALVAGSRIGSYEVSAQIGAGGMGEVYRATDTKLKRQVAIKVLPEALAADVERLARFQREAEVLASLNHQNIAHLHGLEESDGVRALVMELVEGPTLADRIAQGALPVDETLAIAKQIAAALEAAHEQGVTHRDLKPANVKVRPDGTVKVLDFGLAKLAEPTAGSNVAATMSPTLSLNATMAGVILGTAAYMAPEQARGKAVDKRADIWAFGAVLFEMLTGSQPFPGEDVSHVLARVIDRDPDWSLLPPALPSSLRTCLQRCLVKDPRQRLRDIGDVRLVLEGAFDAIATGARHEQSGSIALPLWRRLLPIVGASIVAAAVVGGAVWLQMRPAPPPVTRFVLTTPQEAPIDVVARSNLAIAPDGRTVAYAGVGGLHIRTMGAVDPVAIGGSQRVPNSPVFSPDGASVGFVDGPSPFTLKRAATNGGQTATIAQVGDPPYGWSWGPGDTIVVAVANGLARVSAAGAVEPLATPRNKKESYRWPFVLPNGRSVLFTVWSGTLDSASVAVLSLDTQRVEPLQLRGTSPRYSPTGYLLYATNGSLRAVGFDADRLTVTGGEQATVLENVFVDERSGAAYYDIARNGTLVYYASPPVSNRVTLAMTDTAGKALPLASPGPGHDYPRVSRDGRSVAYQSEFPEGADIAVFEIGSNTAPLRLTFGGNNRFPLWSADGKRVIFQSNREGDGALFWQSRDGTSPAERLTKPAKDESHIPDSVWRDWLTFTVVKGQVSEIWRLSLATKKAERVIAVPGAKVAQSVLSPDGSWIAYQSTVMTGTDIFVEPFPPTGARYQLPSMDANHHPIWAPDGRSLFFVPAARQFARVPISTTPRFGFGTLEHFELNRTARAGGPNQIRRLDIMPDGKQFVGVWPENLAGESREVERRIVVIENWSEELKRLMSR
jgi:eukaryotic-like serine/threonine-protein kinase